MEKCFIAASYHKIRLSVETGGTILRLNLRITSSNFHTDMPQKWNGRLGMVYFHQSMPDTMLKMPLKLTSIATSMLNEMQNAPGMPPSISNSPYSIVMHKVSS